MNKKYKYLKDDIALLKFREENKNHGYEVNRLKGLGEMSMEETEETLVNPQNRIIKQVTVEDVELANKLFEDLMGASSMTKKEYINLHAKEAKYDI